MKKNLYALIDNGETVSLKGAKVHQTSEKTNDFEVIS